MAIKSSPRPGARKHPTRPRCKASETRKVLREYSQAQVIFATACVPAVNVNGTRKFRDFVADKNRHGELVNGYSDRF